MAKLFQIGGDIQDRDGFVYVERGQEAEVLRRIEEAHKPIALSLQAHRQMGKTSFINRMADSLRSNGWLVAKVDLRSFLYTEDSDSGRFIKFVCSQMLESIMDQQQINSWIDEHAGSAGEIYDEIGIIRECAIRIIRQGQPVFFVIDEFEAVTSLGPYVQTLFDATLHCMGMRSRLAWLYAGTQSPQTLVAAEGADPSKYPNFEPIHLADFSASSSRTIAALKEGLSFQVPAPESMIQEVLAKTGGQPFLTCLILDRLERMHLHGQGPELDEVLRSEDLLTNPHFEYPIQQLRKDPVHGRYALRGFEKMLEGGPSDRIDYFTTDFSREKNRLALVQSGLVREVSGARLEVRSPLYERRFDRAWVHYAIRELDADFGRAGMLEVTRKPGLKPRIGIINAGGTLGMDFKDGKVVQPTPGRYWYQGLGELLALAEFADLDPGMEPTDGVNVTPRHWQRIAETVYDNLDRGFDGFIVISGTDSMAYTASAVAFALGQSIQMPVIFTGSQAPYAVVHGDAKANLLRAAQVIADLGPMLPEVTICFDDEVYRAVRAEKRDDFRFAGFHSPSFPPLAVVGERAKLTNIQGRLESPRGKASDVDMQFNFYPQFDDGVLRMSLYPGLRLEMLTDMIRSATISGLVLECLGIGNIPTEGDFNLLPIVDLCGELAIPILISSRYPVAPEFADQYAPAIEPLARGAIAAGNLTPAASLTKFMWVLARVAEEAKTDRHYASPVGRLSRVRELFKVVRVGEAD